MIEFRDIEFKFGNFTAIPDLNLRFVRGSFLPFWGRRAVGKPPRCEAWSVSFGQPKAVLGG